MTAEEIAPFLDPPDLDTAREQRSSAMATTATYPDESFVLPALIKFGGEPFVDEEGHLLYRFPQLQATSKVGVAAWHWLVWVVCLMACESRCKDHSNELVCNYSSARALSSCSWCGMQR